MRNVTVKASTVRGATLAVTVVEPPSSEIEPSVNVRVSFGASSSSMMVMVRAVPKSVPPREPVMESRSLAVPSKKSSSTAVTVAVTDDATLPTPAGRVRDVELMV